MKLYFNENEIIRCFDFAKKMVNNHNRELIQYREDWEICRDVFRGKLGEIAVRNYLYNKNGYNITTDLDFNVMPLGKWDNLDLEINGQAVNVKSIKGNARFLLVECNRYDQYGNYRYKNNDGSNVRIDYYILVRVNIDPEINRGVFNIKSYDELMYKAWNPRIKAEVKRDISAEVLGIISHNDFWKKKRYAPAGIKCSIKNLEAICNDVSIENLPDKRTGREYSNQILQKDNYVLDSYYGLSRI